MPSDVDASNTIGSWSISAMTIIVSVIWSSFWGFSLIRRWSRWVFSVRCRRRRMHPCRSCPLTRSRLKWISFVAGRWITCGALLVRSLGWRAYRTRSLHSRALRGCFVVCWRSWRRRRCLGCLIASSKSFAFRRSFWSPADGVVRWRRIFGRALIRIRWGCHFDGEIFLSRKINHLFWAFMNLSLFYSCWLGFLSL